MTALQASYLVPTPSFLVESGLFLALLIGLVLVPLARSILLRQWVWTGFVIVLGPLAGLAWFVRARTNEV